MKIFLFFIMILTIVISPVVINADTTPKEEVKNQMQLKSQMLENKTNSFDYWCLNDYLNKITAPIMDRDYVAEWKQMDTKRESYIIKIQYELKKDSLEQNDYDLYPQYAKKIQELDDMINNLQKQSIKAAIGDKDLEMKLEKIGEVIYNKYSSDENYVIHPEHGGPELDWVVGYNMIYLFINGENPLKMSKAQEILTDYNNTKIERSFILPLAPEEGICNDTLKKILNVKLLPKILPDYESWVNLRGDTVLVKTSSVESLFERGYLVLPWN